MQREELFNFIKELSTRERQYFTREAANNTQYYDLYNSLNQIGDFTDPAVNEKFEEVTPDTPRELSKKLIRILRNYQLNASSKKKFEVKQLLIDAALLMDKRAYNAAKKVLINAKKAAKEIHSYQEVIQVNNLLLEISYFSSGEIEIQKEINKLIEENIEQQKLLDEQFSWLQVYSYMFSLRIKETLRIEEIYKEKLRTDDGELNSELAKFHFLQSKLIESKFLQETDKVVEYNRRMLKWWDKETNKIYKENEYERFLLTKINLINVLATDILRENTENKRKEIDTLVEEIKKAQEDNYTNLSARINRGIQMVMMNVYSIKGAHSENKNFLKKLLSEEGHPREKRCIFEYTYISTLFNLKEFNHTLSHIDEYLAEYDESTFGNVHHGLHVVHIAVLISIRNYDEAKILIKNYLEKNATREEENIQVVCELMQDFDRLNDYELNYRNLSFPDETKKRKKLKKELQQKLSSKAHIFPFADDLHIWIKSLRS